MSQEVIAGIDAARRVAWAKWYNLRRDLVMEIAKLDAEKMDHFFPKAPGDDSSVVTCRHYAASRERLRRALGDLSRAEWEVFHETRNAELVDLGFHYLQLPFQSDEFWGGGALVRPEWLLDDGHVLATYEDSEWATHIIGVGADWVDDPYGYVAVQMDAGLPISALCGARPLSSPRLLGTHVTAAWCTECLDRHTAPRTHLTTDGRYQEVD